jgi:hypothetical protein
VIADERRRSGKIPGCRSLGNARRFRYNEQDERTMLNDLEPVDDACVVCGIDPIQSNTFGMTPQPANMSMRLFGCMVVLAKSRIMNVRKRSFGEARQQGTRNDD